MEPAALPEDQQSPTNSEEQQSPANTQPADEQAVVNELDTHHELEGDEPPVDDKPIEDQLEPGNRDKPPKDDGNSDDSYGKTAKQSCNQKMHH